MTLHPRCFKATGSEPATSASPPVFANGVALEAAITTVKPMWENLAEKREGCKGVGEKRPICLEVYETTDEPEQILFEQSFCALPRFFCLPGSFAFRLLPLRCPLPASTRFAGPPSPQPSPTRGEGVFCF